MKLIFLSAELSHLGFRMLHHHQMNTKALARSSSCVDSYNIYGLSTSWFQDVASSSNDRGSLGWMFSSCGPMMFRD